MPSLITRAIAAILALALSLGGLSGCASAPRAPAINGTGVVLAITEHEAADATSGMVGGTGQVIAATTGSVIGSVAGGSAASKASAKLVWQVSIRFEDGIDRSFSVDQRPNYRPGDRVAVSNGTISPLR